MGVVLVGAGVVSGVVGGDKDVQKGQINEIKDIGIPLSLLVDFTKH